MPTSEATQLCIAVQLQKLTGYLNIYPRHIWATSFQWKRWGKVGAFLQRKVVMFEAVGWAKFPVILQDWGRNWIFFFFFFSLYDKGKIHETSFPRTYTNVPLVKEVKYLHLLSTYFTGNLYVNVGPCKNNAQGIHTTSSNPTYQNGKKKTV